MLSSKKSYLVICLKSESVRADFLNANATAQKVTAAITTIIKMTVEGLNSGTVGLGDGDVVGLGALTVTMAAVEFTAALVASVA